MGPGKIFGAVTQELQGRLHFIRRFFTQFFHVGLCFSIDSHATWHREGRQIKACRIARIDLVDLGPSERDHTHMTNLRPSISLVKFDGCDVIA